MSKKDLLERLTRAPSDPVRPRREEEAVAGRPAADAVQTRVGTRVVRRRRTDSPDEAPPVAPVVRRRTAVVVDEEPPARSGPRQVMEARQPAPADSDSEPVRERAPEAEPRSDG